MASNVNLMSSIKHTKDVLGLPATITDPSDSNIT